MADGIPTDPPTSRTIDFGALVRKLLGDEYHKHEIVYRVGRGRTFESSDYGTQGIYGGTQAVVRSGTAQDGGANYITLDTNANGDADDYQSKVVSSVDFATTTSTSRILGYNPVSRVALVSPAWPSNFVLHTGTAQGAGTAVMTLGTGAPSTISGGTLSITGGAGTWTGGTQARQILSYDGSAKVVQVSKWDAPYLVGNGNTDEGAQASFYLDFPDLGSGVVDTTPTFGTVSPTFTRATTATTVLSTGLIGSVASGVPRSYYDPTTLEYLGYLAEGARTNVLLHSASFDNAAWGKGTGSISATNVVSPSGAADADAFTIGDTSSFAWLYQTVSGDASTALTYSIYLKVPTGTLALRLAISDVTLATVNGGAETLTTQWQRFTFSIAAATLSNTGSIGVGFLGLADLDGQVIHAWGAQLEAAAFASSYIPTTTASVTRNADVLTYPTTGWLNAAAGTLFADSRPLTIDAATGMAPVALVGPGTDIIRVAFSTVCLFQAFDDGVSQASLNAGAISANVSVKAAGAYAANDFAVSCDGAAVVTDASGTVGTFTTLQMSSGVGTYLFGPIRRVAYFPQRLLNATLQYITANDLTFSPSTFPPALPDNTTTYRVEKVGPGPDNTYSVSA